MEEEGHSKTFKCFAQKWGGGGDGGGGESRAAAASSPALTLMV